METLTKFLLAGFFFMGDTQGIDLNDKNLLIFYYEWLQIGVKSQVIDNREVKYIIDVGDLRNSITTINQRFAELKEAPPLEDADRFPNIEHINVIIQENRNAVARYREMNELIANLNLESSITDLDRRYDIWDTVRESKRDFFYISVKRKALAKLRDLIGPERYYSTNVPAALPWWNMAEFQVIIPDGSKLWVDDKLTLDFGPNRYFSSYDFMENEVRSYKITVEIEKNRYSRVLNLKKGDNLKVSWNTIKKEFEVLVNER